MYMLELFDAADPARPSDARLLRDGCLRLGRDTAADWFINDPDCELSRTHLELEVRGSQLVARALGSNGVFDDASGDRYPGRDDIMLSIPARLRFGSYTLTITRSSIDDRNVDPTGTLITSPPLGLSMDVPSQWSDDDGSSNFGEGSLLEAFCAGAGLDASMLSCEDPAEIMRRAGAIYRQTVLGVGTLMKERDESRHQHDLSRTTIGATNNNPFKWAPSQRLAIDLLLGESRGFLSGSDALQASFVDIKRHLLATFAGFQGGLREAVETFQPEEIAKAVDRRATVLKSRAALHGKEVLERYQDLVRQLDEGVAGSLERAFACAYAKADQACLARTT